MRGLLILLAGAQLAACAPYEAMPQSPEQWRRRQEAIERQEADRQGACRSMNRDSADYARRCQSRPGDED